MTIQQKYILGSAALVILAAVVVIILVAMSLNTGGGSSTATTYLTPQYTPTEIDPSQAKTIQTQQGSVTVVDPTTKAISSDDSVPQAPTQELASTADYNITYNQSGSSFSILLQSLPLAKARVLAETAFLKLLNISNADACKLTVTEQVPYSLNQADAGINYHLSFCPGALPLQ